MIIDIRKSCNFFGRIKRSPWESSFVKRFIDFTKEALHHEMCLGDDLELGRQHGLNHIGSNGADLAKNRVCDLLKLLPPGFCLAKP